MPAASFCLALVMRRVLGEFIGMIDWFHSYLRNGARRISENFRFLSLCRRVTEERRFPRSGGALPGGRRSEPLHDRLKGGIVPQRIPERVVSEIAVRRKNHDIISARRPLD